MFTRNVFVFVDKEHKSRELDGGFDTACVATQGGNITSSDTLRPPKLLHLERVISLHPDPTRPPNSPLSPISSLLVPIPT